ncbi:hypothetical protein [Enterobacter cloacae complex sp. 288G10]|uniref:hypothetical protein n=1 Tax=Enterobacter cloacae complex sp. 288G10 TaxID=3395859 RepID=UPI003CEB72E9
MYNTDSQTVPADTLCESSSQVKIQLSRSASRALTTAKEILETRDWNLYQLKISFGNSLKKIILSIWPASILSID